MQSDVILDAQGAGVFAGLEQGEGVHLRSLAYVYPIDPENPVPDFQRAIPGKKEKSTRQPTSAFVTDRDRQTNRCRKLKQS